LSDAFNALTFNENVLSDPTKYGIQWTYNLTVYNLQPEDAGLYRCTAGGVDYDATLIVVGKLFFSVLFFQIQKYYSNSFNRSE
jgi:hypothetical protein